MRSAESNPFAPGSDSVPSVWAGRATQLADFADVVRVRRLAGAYERGRVIIGEPGIGKSVLAARIADEARQAGDVVLPTIRLPKGGDPIALLAAAVHDAITERSLGERVASTATGLLDRITAIRAGVTLTLDGGPAGIPHVELGHALTLLGRIAKADNRMLVIHLDEVQNITDAAAMSEMLVVIGDLLVQSVQVADAAGNQHDHYLPVAVLLTGLWNFVDDATRAAGATFARRFKPHYLGYLEDADIRTALSPFATSGWPVLDERGPQTITMTSEALDLIVGQVLGDPFLFQLVGKAAWDAGDGPVITYEDVRSALHEVAVEMRHHAERALERLPQAERALFETLVSLPVDGRTLTNAGRELGKSAAELGTASKRLELRSLIRRDRPIRITARCVEGVVTDEWPWTGGHQDSA